jgi:hypothetical protein
MAPSNRFLRHEIQLQHGVQTALTRFPKSRQSRRSRLSFSDTEAGSTMLTAAARSRSKLLKTALTPLAA